MIMMMQKRI